MEKPKPKQKATFASLVRDLLASLGIHYLTPEHLRLSKTSSPLKNSNHESLCLLFWRALHDLCMVYMANFEVSASSLATESNRLSEEENCLEVWTQVTRYHLYNWGFVCREFYIAAPALNICGSSMLSALGFLLSYGDFFSRQANVIVRLQLKNDSVRLPPYPHEPPLLPRHFDNAVESSQFKYDASTRSMENASTIHLIQRIHMEYGSLQSKLKELHGLIEAKEKYAKRIRDAQIEQQGSTILMGKCTVDDSVLSPYCIWLLRNPSELQIHFQALDRRLSNYQDEKLFYQWILSSTSSRVDGNDRSSQSIDGMDTSHFVDLLKVATQTNDFFQSKELKEIYRMVSKQWKDINPLDKTKAKTKMENAAIKLHQELPSMDVLYLPLESNRQKQKTFPTRRFMKPSVSKEKLQQQVLECIAHIESNKKVYLM